MIKGCNILWFAAVLMSCVCGRAEAYGLGRDAVRCKAELRCGVDSVVQQAEQATAARDTITAKAAKKEKRKKHTRQQVDSVKTIVANDTLTLLPSSTADSAAGVTGNAAGIGGTTAQTQGKAEPSAQKPEEEFGSLEKEWPPVIFEHYIGIKGGYGMGSGRFEPTRENVTHLGLYNFGVIYMFDAISKGNKYVGAVQFELEYQQKGFSYRVYRNSDDIYWREYDVIQLPILWQPYLPLSKKNTNSRLFLNAGPFINYVLSSTEKKYNERTGAVEFNRQYVWDAMRDNRLEYGLAAGIGFRIGIKRFAIQAEFRYNITFSDILKGLDTYLENPFFRSPIDQMNISLQVIYNLSKKR